ncbi:MAG: hypothetical protein CMO55_02620 [Verrucomicrobiales bacterium]|nr:hypothetical protein [Verrucomicrobiales bacterium]
MKGGITHVRNPLTIVAVFAGLAEVGGTVVLPLLEKEVQSVYVWFLMLFPLFLVGVFFWVLYKKHFVLYAPSDFQSDKGFTDVLQGAAQGRAIEKIDQIGRGNLSEPSALEGISCSPENPPDVFEGLGRDAKKVLRTLWKYQTEMFPDYSARWGFGVGIGAPDYRNFQLGVDELRKFELASVDQKGFCYLTQRGIQFCEGNRDAIEVGGETYDDFGN